ncbi:LytR/AlgR family response regulator transcription factor [Sphingomonas tabacisoli]|uniref:LytR/AlgR family response regulator transcription factor n=1 Tax=Sphingomonas tabacisoli TaxID=2249466 RepID=A0ABW4I530_9SPHN
MIRALILDDEPLARRRVKRALAGLGSVEIVGEAGNIREGADLIRALTPNLLLLDVQMPNGDAFELIEQLDGQAPAIIFVTAYDQYAIAAFEARAVDYVLKPVAFDRLALAVERARGVIARQEQEEQLAELRSVVSSLRGELRERADADTCFWVSTRGETIRVPVTDILWIQAERDYARLHACGRSYLYHESLASIAERLDPANFIRVHRSAIIHRRRLRCFRRGQFASLTAVLDEGTEVRVGRTYERTIRSALKPPA